MDKPIVIYDESRGKILAKYVENFGRVCEVDITDQARQAVFRYLMAHGLSLNEHCEDEVDSNMVIEQARTIEPVKHGKWIDDGDCFICSNCRKAFGFLSAKCVTNFCPDCGADMRSGEK